MSFRERFRIFVGDYEYLLWYGAFAVLVANGIIQIIAIIQHS